MVAGQRLIFGSTPTGQRATLNVIAAFERRYCYPETGAAFVKQAANAASGGQVTNIEIVEFLGRPQSPERDTLLRGDRRLDCQSTGGRG